MTDSLADVVSAEMPLNSDIDDVFSQWEATTILNPEQLLGNLQRYRGGHYSLALRLGGMIAFVRPHDSGRGVARAAFTARRAAMPPANCWRRRMDLQLSLKWLKDHIKVHDKEFAEYYHKHEKAAKK